MSLPEHIIIDGNNVLHKPCCLWKNLAFDSARWKLARETERMAGDIADRITIVFDGSIGGRADNIPYGSFEVIFSDAGISADTLIERLVLDSDSPENTVVVTSDRLESNAVSAAGAQVMSCDAFIGLLTDESRDFGNRARGNTETRGPMLGDFFPMPGQESKKD